MLSRHWPNGQARIVKVTVYLVVAKVTEWDIPVNKVLLGLREGRLWQQS